MLAESEKELQRVVDEFYSVCVRRKLRVKVGKSRVMAFERKESKVVDFSNSYRVSVSVAGKCEIDSGGERMEEVKEFKCLWTVLCKYGEMDGEIRERERERERE